MSQPLRVLIVEDSEEDAALLLRELRKGDYEPTSRRVDTAEAMRAALSEEAWDIVISDHAMPRFSALAALALSQEQGLDLPFVIVSGVLEEEAAVEAMRAGARDYLRKGNLARLNAAIARELHEAVERSERRHAEEGLRRYREHLEQLVEERTAALAARSEQLLQAERARAELAENLSREINHRVKNQLTMMAGLLQMQQATAPSPEVESALRDAVTRILAVANLHGQLQASQGDAADVLTTLRGIASGTRGVLGTQRISLSVEGDPVVCPRREITSLAVVMNELITNAVKHGAPVDGRELRVDVRVTQTEDGLRLSVWNSGNPVPADFDPSRAANLGLSLIESLVTDQFQGSFTVRPQNGGTLAEIVVRMPSSPEKAETHPAAVPGEPD